MAQSRIRDWGFIDLTKAIWLEINEGKCVNCQKQIFFGYYEDWQRIIGFTKIIKLRNENTTYVDENTKLFLAHNPDVIGTFIVKCGHCQKLYWFHARESHLKVMQAFELWPQT